MNPEAVAIDRLLTALQGLQDLFWHSPSYLACFWPLWNEDSLVLVLTVIRDWPNNDPDYLKFAFAHLRPHKSYTGAVYICASRSAPSDMLNLIFKAQFARFRGWFKPFRYKSRPILALPLLFGMFLTTLEQRFPRCSAHHNSWLAQQWPGLSETHIRAFEAAQILHWGSLYLCVLFSTFRHLEPYF